MVPIKWYQHGTNIQLCRRETSRRLLHNIIIKLVPTSQIGTNIMSFKVSADKRSNDVEKRRADVCYTALREPITSVDRSKLARIKKLRIKKLTSTEVS